MHYIQTRLNHSEEVPVWRGEKSTWRFDHRRLSQNEYVSAVGLLLQLVQEGTIAFVTELETPRVLLGQQPVGFVVRGLAQEVMQRVGFGRGVEGCGIVICSKLGHEIMKTFEEPVEVEVVMAVMSFPVFAQEMTHPKPIRVERSCTANEPRR